MSGFRAKAVGAVDFGRSLCCDILVVVSDGLIGLVSDVEVRRSARERGNGEE